MGNSQGKGNSSAETNQTATNQQVGVSSGIGLGANSRDNVINVSTADPEVAKTAISGNSFVAANALKGNAYVADSAFNFAGHAADVAAETNKYTTAVLGSTAALSIEANTGLAKKFIEGVSDTAAQNVGLLTAISQQNTETTLQGQRVAGDALQASFAVSRATAPQDANFTVSDTIQKVALYGAIAIAAIFALFFFSKKA